MTNRTIDILLLNLYIVLVAINAVLIAATYAAGHPIVAAINAVVILVSVVQVGVQWHRTRKAERGWR